MTKESLNVLLIQFRPDEVVRKHEMDCFLEKAKLEANQVRSFNVFSDQPTADQLDGIDAIFIGGSGEYLISNGDIPEETEKVRTLITYARERGKPILGICFGAQILTHLLGGEVENDYENKEMGTFEITKTEHAKHCPLFEQLPDSFHVQLGHQDHLSVLPPGAIHLASSKLSKHQAYVIPEERIYAMVFHPELDEPGMHFRLDYYRDYYQLDEKILKELKDGIFASPQAGQSLSLFLEEVVLGKKLYSAKK